MRELKIELRMRGKKREAASMLLRISDMASQNVASSAMCGPGNA